VRRSRALIATSIAAAVTLVLTLLGGSAAASPRGKIVIDVWLAQFPIPGHLDARYAQAAAFNLAHPEYEVRITEMPYTDIPREVYRASRNGTAPDIANYYHHGSQIARDARARGGKPLFTSVERAIAGRSRILGERVVLDDVVEQFGDFYSYRGELLSMPSTAMTPVLYANTTLLQAAGITTIPRTWQEIDAACAQLAAHAGSPDHCISWANTNWFFQQAVAQQGGQLANNDNGRSGRATRVNLATPEMMSFVNWWKRLNDAGHYLYGGYTGTPDDWGTPFGAFIGQQVAFIFDAPVSEGFLRQFADQGGYQIQSAQLPHNAGVRYSGNAVSGDSLWLKAGLSRARQDGALAFMNYLNSPQNAAAYHQSSFYLPMTDPSVDLLQSQGWFAQHPAPKIGIDQVRLGNGRPGSMSPIVGDFDGVQRQFTQAMDDVLVGGADPLTRFRQATADAQQRLNAYNLRCTGFGPRPDECFNLVAAG